MSPHRLSLYLLHTLSVFLLFPQINSSYVSKTLQSIRHPTQQHIHEQRTMTHLFSTRTAPPREKTKRATKRSAPFDFGTRTGQSRTNGDSFLSFVWERGGPLEYLQDDKSVSRNDEDPFHIMLLGATFDKPKITIPYVSGSLSYVLEMPDDVAVEHSLFAEEHGMSCLGTWTHKECEELGNQLQVRDIVCRVVPYCEGSLTPWQVMKSANVDNDYESLDHFN